MLTRSTLDRRFGYVAMIGDTAVIMFRGTNPPEIQDWLVNLNNNSYRSASGAVHAGFWASYETLHDQLVEVLRQKNPKRIGLRAQSRWRIGCILQLQAYD